MQSFVSLITIDEKKQQPVYSQIANQLAELIKNGMLTGGHRLMSTRDMAEQLNVHRKTVVRAYEDLITQGWLESNVGSGTFVSKHLPVISPRSLNIEVESDSHLKKAGFEFVTPGFLERSVNDLSLRYHLDDGFPDPRLAPLKELSIACSTQLRSGNSYARLGYGDPKGSLWLRQELCTYLNETRGMNVGPDNILITRGTIMGFYLSCTGLLKPGDNVACAELGWLSADIDLMQVGAVINKIPVDAFGLNIDYLADLCSRKNIRMVYVNSHHHYPTTVPLRADRRVQLLQLAEKYGFILFEDDYDYDFHYLNKPLLPLATADKAGMVLYCGSFTKAIAPAFRVGYLVASEDVIHHLSLVRRTIDRQGDHILENAMAELLQHGIIQRHLRKSLRAYRERRDVFCSLMDQYLKDEVSFQVPEGGLAAWTNFDPAIDLKTLAKKALLDDLYLNSRSGYSNGRSLNNMRLGFGSSTPQELEHIVKLLRNLIKGI